MSVNSWDTIREDNYASAVALTTKYGPHRVVMSLNVKDILNKAGACWYIDTGTLVGAYRNGKMLPHDDDFDIGLLGTEDDLDRLHKILQNELSGQYKVRRIDTYCKKLEVYEESHGRYVLDEKNGYDYHHVTIDIQLYCPVNEDDVQIMYTRDNYGDYIKLKKDMIVPLGKIQYEGNEYNAPHDVEEYLTAHYGCLEEGAVFNKETMKYEMKR